ncbi:MAG: SAM-dependent methyltransferase [Halobacteriales archaeon]|nr:SAM-dependent methyltransferase [Halobacteriales archaeon]
MALADRLRQRIAADGPMPFDAWMEACLYDPEEGYYVRPGRKTGAGEDADFATSPTLHPFFGAAVGMEAAAVWERIGRPTPFPVVEFGGGEGDLARGALRWLDRERPDLARRVQWVHVERSPAHRAKQAGADRRLAWAEAMPRLDAAFLVANEFLDALPFKWLERTGAGWSEVHVAWDGHAFAEALLPSGLSPPANVPPGVRVALHQGARAWLHEAGAALGRGEALIIDYGERYLWGEERPDGSVRTYRRHEDAGTPLQNPGDQDITASLDFAELEAWAREAGWREAWHGTQEAWLIGHGILDALNATRRDTAEGASAYLRLRQILLPTGLGSFKVLRLVRRG